MISLKVSNIVKKRLFSKKKNAGLTILIIKKILDQGILPRIEIFHNDKGVITILNMQSSKYMNKKQ